VLPNLVIKESIRYLKKSNRRNPVLSDGAIGLARPSKCEIKYISMPINRRVKEGLYLLYKRKAVRKTI
jgi:hypothetical protein